VATAYVRISVTVLDSCTIEGTAKAIRLAGYHPVVAEADSPLDASPDSVTVKCSPGTHATLGNTSGSSSFAGPLPDTSSRIAYTYSIGNNTGAELADSATQAYSVAVALPPRQAVPEGAYADDSLVVTVDPTIDS
jgi:spore coat protein U-like protein